MEVAYGEAEAFTAAEAARRGVHTDGGWCEGVVGGKDEGAPVLAAGVDCVGWAGEDVVPFEDVGF